MLPFENLSNDKEDASFADGVQDDLLTKLAKIADLKVISRTSVMGYQGRQNTRQIGKELGISHVLEEYDRDLKDLFAVQSEIAQKVAQEVHAKISPAEKLAIEHVPTANLTAFDLYSGAKNLILAWNYTPNERGNLLQAADLLNQAVTHDPMFFQAYCQLAWVHDQLYFFGHDHTSARLALADAAIQAAFQLRPNAGEAHLARAGHLYRANLDYDGALAELETARQTLPNDARLFQLKGSIERRRPGGNQKEALRNFERAIDLDPRNVFILAQTSLSYDVLRRYADEEALLDRMLAIQPKDVDTKVSRALVELDWKANTRPLHQVMGEIRAKEPDSIQPVADTWLVCALAERDAAAAASALTALGENRFGYATVKFGPRFVEGLIARMMQDGRKARSAFAAARAEQEKIVEAQPNYAPVLCVLGLIDAALGAKDQALREGRRAVELLSVKKDEINGPRMITYFAIIAAWVGDKDLACEQLAVATRFPSSPSYGELKLLPFWDPLRGDPCFEKIVASLAPKEN